MKEKISQIKTEKIIGSKLALQEIPKETMWIGTLWHRKVIFCTRKNQED